MKLLKLLALLTLTLFTFEDRLVTGHINFSSNRPSAICKYYTESSDYVRSSVMLANKYRFTIDVCKQEISNHDDQLKDCGIREIHELDVNTKFVHHDKLGSDYSHIITIPHTDELFFVNSSNVNVHIKELQCFNSKAKSIYESRLDKVVTAGRDLKTIDHDIKNADDLVESAQHSYNSVMELRLPKMEKATKVIENGNQAPVESDPKNEFTHRSAVRRNEIEMKKAETVPTQAKGIIAPIKNDLINAKKQLEKLKNKKNRLTAEFEVEETNITKTLDLAYYYFEYLGFEGHVKSTLMSEFNAKQHQNIEPLNRGFNSDENPRFYDKKLKLKRT
jgi:hypothetical protein